MKIPFQVPIEIMGHMQQIYQRALCQLGPDVGCYAPPKLLEVSHSKHFDSHSYGELRQVYHETHETEVVCVMGTGINQKVKEVT